MNETTTAASSSRAAAQARKPALRHDPSDDQTSTRVAHTLTACSRCRQRKTRCDPGLPRCGPCERTNAVCEYWDPAKHRNINRDYVVWLQHRARDLEIQADKIENEDGHEDPESMVRSAAAVKLQFGDEETKFLGPSSGTQITRLVMQLAKQFTDSKTIKDIVPDAKARQVKELFAVESEKPTSKVYPLISDVAAVDLPNRELTDLLLQLFNLKVQPMYPALHEPTFAKDVEEVYAGRGNDYQNYILRMVIAISLQKMDQQYAGLADSYYLAALKYMHSVVRPMDLKTLQCFALVAEYSLLTPTRTAIYYIMGLAVRLVQALGIHEEKTIMRGKGGANADFLEVDMRRRLFWCVFVMECGLNHALGRPVSLATGQEHLDVGWFETCSDEYITPQGVLPGAQPTLKKWICIHFFKMRLLQLEIRRKLYLQKRPTPENDQDPWFQQMNAKLEAWRDASPDNDAGSGLNKAWFIGRYSTMIVFLFRPSPQVPKPSLAAALKCFEACRYAVYLLRAQITAKNVDLTWIFTQSIFMAINTLLWTLSFAEVRKQNPKAEVQAHLATGLEAIDLAASRWPGVASAHELYVHITSAILKIYDKDGDVAISEDSPSDAASPANTLQNDSNRSRTTSPATFSNSSLETPPDRVAPFGYFNQTARRSVEQPPPLPYKVTPDIPASSVSPAVSPPAAQHINGDNRLMPQQILANISHNASISIDPLSQFRPLPTDFENIAIAGWNPAFTSAGQSMPFAAYTSPMATQLQGGNMYPQATDYGYSDPNENLGDQAAEFLNPNYWNEPVYQQGGLTSQQQLELLQNLETSGMEDIEMMIEAGNRVWNPQSQTS